MKQLEASSRYHLHHGGIVPVTFLIVFYVNYFILIPHYLFKGRTKEYFILNILLILCTAIGVHFWQDYISVRFPRKEHDQDKPMAPPRWIFFLRDIFSMILTVGLSTAIRLSGRWGQIEAARREAEKSRTEAELKNLRNQLNPHFLLNTLNNIYALYDNQQNFVPLGKEMDFIRNYIELMRIRLSSNVTVETAISVRPDSRTEIAPLIFISLIENAFKHGISPTEPSYIRIHFSESEQEVRCEIYNSYHPKNEADKSGSGIGLEQVRKRLELTYPGRYNWEHGVSEDNTEYRSVLVINI